MIQFEGHIFQMGWFNHQQEEKWQGFGWFRTGESSSPQKDANKNQSGLVKSYHLAHTKTKNSQLWNP